MGCWTMPPTTKNKRIEARVTPETKAVIEHAAALEGISITDFIVRAARDAAEQTIWSHEVITLSAQDSLLFVDALLNPPAPNDALRRILDPTTSRIRA